MRRGRYFILLLFLVMAFPLFAQVEVADIGSKEEQLVAAQAAFSDLDLDRASTLLEKLTLEEPPPPDGEPAPPLSAPEAENMAKAWMLLGRVRYSLGQRKGAKEAFLKMLELRPEWSLPEDASPKIIRLLDQTRTRATGVLVLTLSPATTEVIVDGRLLPSSLEIPLWPGTHHLEFKALGFETQEENYEIQAKEKQEVIVHLIPNARTLVFFSSPRGAKITIDGVFKGTCDHPAADDPILSDFVSQKAGDPSDTYYAMVPAIDPGTHQVAMRLPCHETLKFPVSVTLDLVQNSYGLVRPVSLARVTTSCEMTSPLPNGQLFLDEKSQGSLPYLHKNLCAGRHSIQVTFPQGQWKKVLEVGDSPIHLRVLPRPTVLFLGLSVFEGMDGSVVKKIRETLKVRRPAWNLVEPEKTEANPLLPDLLFLDHPQERLLSQLVETSGANALMALKAEKGGLRIALWSPEWGMERLAWSSEFGETPFLPWRPWWGLTLADSPMDHQLVVVAVDANGPLAGKMMAGAKLLEIEPPTGNPQSVLESWKEGMTIETSGGTVSLPPPGWTWRFAGPWEGSTSHLLCLLQSRLLETHEDPAHREAVYLAQAWAALEGGHPDLAGPPLQALQEIQPQSPWAAPLLKYLMGRKAMVEKRTQEGLKLLESIRWKNTFLSGQGGPPLAPFVEESFGSETRSSQADRP